MRLCVSVPCFFPGEDLCVSLRRLAALGFDAAELWGWRGLDLPRVRAAVEETGVELLSMCTTEFRMTDPALRGAWLSGLRESVAAAGELGVRKLITQVGPDTGAPREAQRASIVEALRQAAPILEAGGVTLMIEPLNVLVDHPGYFLTRAAEGFDILREVAHPLVRMVYDIYHQQISEGNIVPTVLDNLPYIAHLHGAGHPGRHELWEGESDYRFILRKAEAAGYTGALGLEYKPLLDPEESLREAMRRCGG